MRAINAVRELNEERDEPIRVIALYTEEERHALFVRQADERHCLGPAMVDRRRRRAAQRLPRLRAPRARARRDAAPTRPGSAGASSPSTPPSPSSASASGSSSSAPTPTSCARWATRSRASGSPSRPACRSRRGAAARSRAPRTPSATASELGFPLMIKAAAGGGGRGMRRVDGEDEVAEAFERARAEAAQAFGDPSVLMERLVGAARHVEVQLMADGQGGVWALGVRDCSYQRRHQKVVEESASPALSAEQERELAEAGDAARARRPATAAPAPSSSSTSPTSGRFSFMEVNTRLQVEHPVTEVVTGADLVRLQLHVAAGGRLEGDPPPAARPRDRGPPQRRGPRPRLRARARPHHAAAAARRPRHPRRQRRRRGRHRPAASSTR